MSSRRLVRRARAGCPRVARAVVGLLTGRGWCLAGGCVAFVVAGRAIGIEELYALAAAGFAALAAAVTWTRSVRWQVEVQRRVTPGRFAAGKQATVALEIRNCALRATPVLSLCDPFGADRRSGDRLLAPLRPGETAVHRYHLPPAARGVYTIGPLTAAASDPFGLSCNQRVLAPAERLVVHPPINPLRSSLLPSEARRLSGAPSSQLGADGELATLREYREGDDVRRIHWVSSARRDVLLVREDEQPGRGSTVVVVDLRQSVWTPLALEVGLATAASLADDTMRRRVPTQLVTTGGADTGLASGPGHQARILDELAVAATHRGGALSLAGPPRGRGQFTLEDAIVVVTSDRVSQTDLQRIRRQAGPAPVTVVNVATGRRSARPAQVVAVTPPERPSLAPPAGLAGTVPAR